MRPGKTHILPKTRSTAFRVTVYRDLAEARSDWRALQAVCAGGPHDSEEWAGAWWRCVGRRRGIEPVIAVGHDGRGGPLFLLPLGLRRAKGLTILEWLASAHGNYAGGLLHPCLWQETDGRPGPALLEAVKPHLPATDLIHLDAVPETLGDGPGPLAGLPMIADGAPGFAFVLAGDREDIIRHHLGKKARGNLRRSERRLAEQGELRFRLTSGADDTARALGVLFEQKRVWCQQSGVPDFLAPADIRRFYEALLAQPPGGGGCEALLYVLELDGEIIATNLGMRFGDALYGLITTISQGEARRHSPGNVLFRKMVEDAASRGVRVIDWGAGDNRLKSVWCDIERKRGHVVIPLTAKGAAAAVLLRARLRAKAAIKSSSLLWGLAGRARRLKSGLAAFAGAPGTGLWSRLASRRVEA